VLATTDGAAKVNVPAGALTTSTVITITPATSSVPGAVGQVWEIGPTGTQFSVPVTLTLAYADSELGTMPATAFAVSTVVSDTWQPIAATVVNTSEHVISGQTTHLSPYALSAVVQPTIGTISDAGDGDAVEGGNIAAGIDEGGAPGDGIPDTPRIAFDPMYSAYISDSSQVFEVPAVVAGVSGVTVRWGASNTSMVGLQADPQTGGVMIVVLAAGTLTINAQVGTDGSWSAPLTITQFTGVDWSAGNARYNNGVPLISLTDAGGPISLADPSPFEPPGGGPGPACTNCHGPTATVGMFQGLEETPEQMGGFSDQQLIDIVVNGIIPDGGYYDSTIIPYPYWQYFHRWRDLTPQQQTGIVAYLRSLTPSPQEGMVDFGGSFTSGAGLQTAPDAGTPDGAPEATADATLE
jgi:hypothetical protein